jgi:hypothetical protein
MGWMMGQYRTKPVVVEAMEWDGSVVKMGEFLKADWGIADDTDTIIIFSQDGDMLASVGDFVIQGIQGEFYTCKAGMFDLIYEEVGDES